MTIRSLALCALPGLWACLNAVSLTAANLPAVGQPEAPLAIYYSFELTPPISVFNEMQVELGRILGPANLRVTWRALDADRKEGETFREVIIMKFRGGCTFERAATNSNPQPVGGMPLAETDLVDGHVLPFGEVECDELNRYIAPVTGTVDNAGGNLALGRAMARVAAHEIYHMLTGSANHARSGIARAEHSRAELTATTFDFARTETQWLRNWVESEPKSQLGTR